MYSYVARMYPYVLVCYSYVLVCYSYVLVWCFSHDQNFYAVTLFLVTHALRITLFTNTPVEAYIGFHDTTSTKLVISRFLQVKRRVSNGKASGYERKQTCENFCA